AVTRVTWETGRNRVWQQDGGPRRVGPLRDRALFPLRHQCPARRAGWSGADTAEGTVDQHGRRPPMTPSFKRGWRASLRYPMMVVSPAAAAATVGPAPHPITGVAAITIKRE